MIRARGLARSFRSRAGTVRAVEGVDLDVAAAEVVGFLGPNGAGKTTTMRMLTTLLRPDAGEAVIAGADLRRDPVGVRRRIGYVGQSGGSGPEVPVREELVVQGRLQGLGAGRARARADALCGALDLTGLEARPTRALSGGQRRRLDLAMALVHEPPVLFLDEPTTGLDPHSRADVWDHLRSLRARTGTTVFLSTHHLEEAEALCDRVLVMDAGRIVAAGTPDELKARLHGDAVELVAAAPGTAAAVADACARVPGVEGLAVDGDAVRLRVPRGDTALPLLLRAADAAGHGLASVAVRRPSMDDVFLALTGRPLDGPAPAPVPAPAPRRADEELVLDAV
ncbi:ATP-binding cassette domain-containing protein [Vallicoccus soli]|uniref:ATP-binding cassette domain-containing protein n=1 Tax=Vallicoccus soli TaxID=2339232 RepID=A0A3A3Z8G3_9ACTN|nr:ATP-binding cassette domain-containing protein [Vallicoccus soli]RJK98197.1 ATP-binding cassette domain-containing protein [Vallicoccus soli]